MAFNEPAFREPNLDLTSETGVRVVEGLTRREDCYTGCAEACEVSSVEDSNTLLGRKSELKRNMEMLDERA